MTKIFTAGINYFSVEDVYNVRIETEEEVKQRFVDSANQWVEATKLPLKTIDDLNVGPIPDVLITYEIGGNSDSGEVYVELWDTGHEEDDGRKVYDMGFSTNNNDNWGMIQTQSAINAAVQKHFELDLHKRFPMTGENC